MKDDIKKEITYKYLKEDELNGISRLIKSMKKQSDDILYIRNNSIEYYQWMYFNNPAGDAVIASAWHKGVLIATFALAPKKALINGTEMIFGKPMDMFTDPDYQGLSIMSVLTKMVFEEAYKKGIDAWFINPSGNSYPIFKNKWGYKELFEMFFRYRILNLKILASTIKTEKSKKAALKAAAFFGNPFVSLKRNKNYKYDIQKTEYFDQRFDELWERAKKDYKNAIVRDSTYLNWRYNENPDKYDPYILLSGGKIYGYVVTKNTLRRGVKTGEIMDIFYDRDLPDAGHELLLYAQERLYEQGCGVCQAWDFEDSLLSKLYLKAGLKKKRAIVKTLFSPDCEIPNFYNKEHWLMTESDGNDV